ncbi:MAG: site-specific integrase [Bdellovibrionaceae bacterium]|nr:site-specific integrase [Pseudobdellovibrionaceae bacterium]NUM58966.1 site-specific integrase [Pseudobdellovibrionaceae bacterium]
MAIKSYTSKGKKLFEVYVNGFNSRGKRIQMRKRGVESITKAKDLEFEFERELALHKNAEVHLRWSEWYLECISLLKVSCRPSTVYSFEKVCTKWINKHFDEKELRSISKLDIHELIHEKVVGEKVTPHTRKYVLKLVKRTLQMAVDHGKLDKNNALGLQVKVPETDQKVLTNSEVEKLLQFAHSTNHHFYPVWLVALFTGMRSGELYALKWTEVDFETKSIHVIQSWNSKNGFTPTKNQKNRVVPISEDLINFLKEQRLRATNEFVLPRLNEWERGDAAHVLGQVCIALGITKIRFHDLRATFITNLLSRGESLARVMAIVGHADIETTNVYLRKAGIELAGGTDKLGYSVPQANSGKILRLV